MQILTILFQGLCCHIEPPNGKLPGISRRTILQDLLSHDPKHYCYIEFYKNDFDPATNTIWKDIVTDEYTRCNYKYQRVELKNVQISLRNKILSSPPLQILPSFRQRIPRLTDLDPTFDKIDESYLELDLEKDLVGAYFDISAGILSSGPTEHFRTFFKPEFNWSKRHLGQWAQLDLEIEGASPVLQITDLTNKNTKLLVLKPGTDVVTIGNQTQDAIAGRLPQEPGKDEHFSTFYLLGKPLYKPAPQTEGLGLGTGCSNSSWP